LMNAYVGKWLKDIKIEEIEEINGKIVFTSFWCSLPKSAIGLSGTNSFMLFLVYCK
jgi:hypothetical protein